MVIKICYSFAIFSLVTTILTFSLSNDHIWNCRNLNCYIFQIDLDILFKCFITLIDYCKAIKSKSKMNSFKSNENIHKIEDGSDFVVSANKASSVTL